MRRNPYLVGTDVMGAASTTPTFTITEEPSRIATASAWKDAPLTDSRGAGTGAALSDLASAFAKADATYGLDKKKTQEPPSIAFRTQDSMQHSLKPEGWIAIGVAAGLATGVGASIYFAATAKWLAAAIMFFFGTPLVGAAGGAATAGVLLLTKSGK